MSALQEYFDPSHQLVRDSVRRFIEREVLPHIADWEEAEEFPREVGESVALDNLVRAEGLSL